jgi:rhodanese-related sulfurtransferase
MKPLAELALVVLLASAGALATWMVAGPPDRAIACDPAKMSAEEICLATVKAEWPDALWIDARSQEAWKTDGLPGSIHLTTMGQVSFDEQLAASFDKLANAQRAVVYCDGLNCNLSKEVVRQIKDYKLPLEAKALYGGVEALKAAGMMVKGSSPAN